VCVSIGVQHELDAALSSLLLTFADSIEDRVEHTVEIRLSNRNNRVDHPCLHVGIVRIHRVTPSEDGSLTILNNDCVYDPLYKSDVRIYLNAPNNSFLDCFDRKLGLCLLEHPLLLCG